MISSEVQRTLVKSPPELWAELSDPALLARHLGELGEIRITRVEPEQTVEWEAENTSGSVQIKPSGWGTRVTLTVTRELPEGQETAGAGASPAPEPTPGSEPEPTPPPQADPDRQSDDRPETQAGTAFLWHAAPDPPGEIDCDPAWPAEGQGSFAPDPPPAAELEREADETRPEIAKGEPEPLGDDDAQPDTWLLGEEPEQRRGFFARLFGRRRRAQGAELEAIDSPGEIESLAEIGEVCEPAEEIAPDDADSRAPASSQDVETLSASAADPSLAPESCQPQASFEPLVDSAPVEDWRDRAQIDQPRVALADPAHARDVSGELNAAATPQGLAKAEGDPSADENASAEEDASAEEVARAEVTALLTSVLDRLGAAHHRPFSRS
jgi:hypothetical protein